MLTIKKISAKNFLSIGNVMQNIDLDILGLTLVLGENVDLGGNASRNGVGKSALIQAICFGLYGEPLTRIKKDNLINNVNEKNMAVSIEFEKDGSTYKIERGRKPNFLRYLVNNNVVNAPDTDESEGDSKWTQMEINRILGISYTMFRHIVALNTFTEPFLAMRAGEQRETIEHLLGITLLSEKAKTLSELNKTTKDQIKDEETKIQAQIEANARIQKSIDSLMIKSNSWDSDHARKLHQLAKEIEMYSHINFDTEIQKFDLLDEWINSRREWESALSILQKELRTLLIDEKANQTNLAKLKMQLNTKKNASVVEFRKNSIDRAQRDINRKNEKIKNYELELVTLAESYENPNTHNCSQCGQSIDGTAHLEEILKKIEANIVAISSRIEAEKNDIINLTLEITNANDEIKQLELEDNDFSAEILLKIQELEKLITTSTLSISEKKEEIGIIEQALNDSQDKPETMFDNRQQAYLAKSDYDQKLRDYESENNNVNPFTDQIKTLQIDSLVTISYENMNEMVKRKEHQEFLLKLLTNKESFIRKKIIDQNLTYLNSRLHHYLDKLGLPHQVRFLNDLSVEITQLGRDLDFDNLSRGERTRLILGLSWAFRDIFESLNTGINLLFVDELLDNGLDPSGLENALELLKKMGRERGKNIFLISHREELTTRVNNILLVKKENGFTVFDTDAE